MEESRATVDFGMGDEEVFSQKMTDILEKSPAASFQVLPHERPPPFHASRLQQYLDSIHQTGLAVNPREFDA
jgi:hypothetical protein